MSSDDDHLDAASRHLEEAFEHTHMYRSRLAALAMIKAISAVIAYLVHQRQERNG